MDASDHQRNVRQTLEGNERVWFHSHEDKLAVWHGGPQITIVSSRTFEEIDVMNIRTFDKSMEEAEAAANVKVAIRGFDRDGRTNSDTNLVEA